MTDSTDAPPSTTYREGDLDDIANTGLADPTSKGELVKAGAAANEVPSPDRRKKAVLGIPIEVVVSVGKARPYLTELVALRRDSVIPLDTNISDPVEIMIGGRVIARGELQEIESGSGRLGVRLTEVVDLTNSV